MKGKTLCILALISGLILAVLSPHSLSAQEQERTAVIIPEQVKAVFQEGMQARQPRTDIPFAITDTLYLPAQQNIHLVVFFKAKNADLGFAPPDQVAAVVAEEEQPASPKLTAQCYVFLQFNKLENGTPGELAREVYVPMNLEADSASFDAEKEEIYTTGYPLPPGDYLLSMALANKDLSRIGTQYKEISLPDPLGFTDTIDTTPIFFAKSIKQVAAPETRAEVHKDFFAYSILQIDPNMEKTFSVGDNLDIFFFIFGAKANEQGQTDLKIHYQVFQGDELAINFQPQTYTAPLVSQQLPMKKTVLIKTTKGTETTEKTERRDLEPGTYTLAIDITDNISGQTLKKTIDFEIR